MKANKLAIFCRKRLPTILTVVGTISELAALYFTGKATVQAVRKYDTLKANGIEMTPKNTIKKLIPYYIPAIGFATTSMACSIACNTIHLKRNRALTIAATSAIETLRDFKSKAKDLIGEEKVTEIETERAKETNLVRATSYFTDEIVHVYDVFTGVKFETTSSKLIDAETEVNRNINSICWGKSQTDLRDFYRWMGVDYSSDYIWNQEYMVDTWELSFVDFYHKQTLDDDGTKLIILKYFPEPETEGEIVLHCTE